MARSVGEIIQDAFRGHALTPEDISVLASTLGLSEMIWRGRSEMLRQHGYILRPRLRPGWTPSWFESGMDPLQCEDGQRSPPRPHSVDATHESTGKLVYIKEVSSDSEGCRIAQLLMQAEWSGDPRNHCVPVKDVFKDPQDESISYIVMPFLRPMDSPPFECVKEIVDFVDQILEGLVFLHEQGIAHRDCVGRNIMMDADTMYPEGFHPIKMDYTPDCSNPAVHATRTIAGVKYYFMDFRLSTYTPDHTTTLVTGSCGRDQDPPELLDIGPYNPFKLDIYIIGNMLKKEFLKPFPNLGFIEPLVAETTRPDPYLRCDARETLALWKEIRASLWVSHPEWLPQPRLEHDIEMDIPDASSVGQLTQLLQNL